MSRQGIDPGTIGRMLGHSPAVAMRYYRQASLEDAREAVRRAGLGSLGGKVIPFSKGD